MLEIWFKENLNPNAAEQMTKLLADESASRICGIHMKPEVVLCTCEKQTMNTFLISNTILYIYCYIWAQSDRVGRRHIKRSFPKWPPPVRRIVKFLKN